MIRPQAQIAFKLFFGLAAICAVTLSSAITIAASNTSNNLTVAAPVGAMHMSPPGNARTAESAAGDRHLTAKTNKVIVTESGPLEGMIANGINEYLGIPYAAPPVGSLRWVPPQPFGMWKGVLQATQFGNACVQPDGLGGTFGSEDCLSLNVYSPGDRKGEHTPANKNDNEQKHKRLPVMVWIHGGGFTTGGGGFYDPTPLVQQGNVIVVTINYRLGPLGIFAHPAIDAEGHLNVNYCLMDQQFALKWVQQNIRAFGGDRDRVTIFGESAGGLSIYSNLASPTAADLFQGAIVESGAYQSFAGSPPFDHYLNGKD
jgi:para-nitrobenzyl esterase